MAKKAVAKSTTKSPKGGPSTGVLKRLKKVGTKETFIPNTVEKAVDKYVFKRMNEMVDFRQSLKIEAKWKQADEEYVPHELDFGSTRKRFETDQDTGLRSRQVPVGDSSQQWRQQSSSPTLLGKIQTAVSIIVDNQPEAELVALLKKYDATTDLAYALWKRNWSITNSKEKLKLIVFDLIKYGWAAQRTYPRLIKYPKLILDEKDPTNSENDKYITKDNEWFNDIDREPLDPFRTWIDEMSKPYDPYSTNECYFERDYSYDQFMVEFGAYPNSAFVPEDSYYPRIEQQQTNTNRQNVAPGQGQSDQTKTRQDIVTVGFFESRTKDLYAMWLPKHRITLYNSPLPNDDGYLSVTHTMWILRNSKLPYGISLWEIIRQNKALYDKMKNMGMDQLVLSIMKFGFFSGTSTALGDGKIDIIPGQARQLTTSSGSAKDAVHWMEIPGPGQDFWKGIEAISTMMDNDSGLPAMLESADTPGQQTLGELLHRKEAALKRLKTPVDNIAWLIDQDAYVTLSWMSQLYAMPTIKQFTDEKEMMEFERQEQIQRTALFGTPSQDGSFTGPYEAHYHPQLSLHLEDSEGKLVKSKESKFFQVGKEIMPSQLKWKGTFKTIPRSIIDSSETLVRASKTELFNILMPLFQFPPELVAKPAQQLCKVNEEDPADWLPDSWMEYLDTGQLPMTPPQGTGQGTSSTEDGAPAAGGDSIQSATGTGAIPSAQTVVPAGQVSSAPTASGVQNGGGPTAMGIFSKRL